ncbi:MAG TPA: hypothetical protein QF353_02680 [Gammaproteobacteria bacterium]|nr:hypothetical protein [Gammaproteobacteria bacterium]
MSFLPPSILETFSKATNALDSIYDNIKAASGILLSNNPLASLLYQVYSGLILFAWSLYSSSLIIPKIILKSIVSPNLQPSDDMPSKRTNNEPSISTKHAFNRFI